MEILNFKVSEKEIKCDKKQIIGGNDYQANFTLDEEWENKEVVCRVAWANRTSLDITLDNSTCVIPAYMLKAGKISVGIYTEDGENCSTSSCDIGIIASIKEKSYSTSVPNEEIWKEINESIKNSVKNNEFDEKVDLYMETAGYNKTLKSHTLALKDLDTRLESKMNSIYTSNQGENYVNDCQAGDIRSMKLYGATTQKRYTGTNLLEKMEAGNTATVSGVTFTVQDDGGIMVSGTNESETEIVFRLHDDTVNVLERGNYCFSAKGVSESVFANIYYVGNVQSDITDKTLAFTLEENTYTVVLKVKAGETVNGVVYVTLTAEENGGTFEPYTGGEPSPNPTCPQELTAVEEINVRLCGKNLAGILADETKTTYGVATVRDVANQTITLNGTSTQSTGLSLLTDNCVYTGEKKGTLKAGTYCFRSDAKITMHLYRADTLNAQSVSVSSGKTLTLEEDFYYCDMQVRWSTGAVFDNVTATVQLERGDTPTAYEPYTEQSFAVIPPKPLNAVGDYKDVCDVENGVWRYRTKTLSFNGSEAWKSETSGIGVRYYLVSDTVEAGINTENKLAVSNLLPLTQNAGTWSGKNCFSSHDSKNMLYVSLQGTETLEEFKKLLEENTFVITHQTDTEETIVINDDDLANLNALQTYYDTTHLFVTDQNGNDITTWFTYHFNLKPYVEYVKGQLADGKELIYDMQAKQLEADVSNAWSLINAEYAAAVTDFS